MRILHVNVLQELEGWDSSKWLLPILVCFATERKPTNLGASLTLHELYDQLTHTSAIHKGIVGHSCRHEIGFTTGELRRAADGYEDPIPSRDFPGTKNLPLLTQTADSSQHMVRKTTEAAVQTATTKDNRV